MKIKSKLGKINSAFYLVGLMFAVFAIASVRYFDPSEYLQPAPAVEQHQEPIQPQEAVALRLESRMLMVGDVFWGRNNQRLSEMSQSKYMYNFERLDSFERKKYDFWVANLECPVTNKAISFSVQKEQLIFNCLPEYLGEFSKWFDAVSLANNHTDNVNGVSGLLETRKHLESSGIQYFGHYDPNIANDRCEVLAVDSRLAYSNGEEETAYIPIVFCGYQYVYSAPRPGDFAQIKEYSMYFPVVAYPHMGAEYVSTADTLKRQTYRQMVDSGADLVVGSHPHWVQDAEVYKGKLIMYSLGNFLFDQAWSEEVQKGLALDVLLSMEYNENTKKWLELAARCLDFKDRCLQDAQQMKLKKANYQLVYDVVASRYANGQTFRGDTSLQLELEERTNWLSVSAMLNPHD